jgi:hypothetical protein
VRGKLQAFQNLYAFLSQVIPYQDSDLERLYVFLRHLATKLPKRASGAAYQFDGSDFNQADQLFFDQIVEAAMTDDALGS